MIQPNQEVAQILASITQATKTPTALSSPTPFKYALSHAPQSEELTLSKQTLVSIITRVIEGKDRAISQRDAQIELLREGLWRAEETIARLSGGESNEDSQIGQEKGYRKIIHELQKKIDSDIRKREQLEQDLKLSHIRIRDQLIQLDKLRHIVAAREAFIKNIVADKRKKNNHQPYPHLKTEQAYNPLKADLTPLATTPSLLDRQTDQPGRFNQLSSTVDPSKKSHSSNISPIVLNKPEESSKFQISSFNPSSETANQELRTEDKFYRHSNNEDKKDKIIKKLVQKCLGLQGHIQVLTKKLLGYLGGEVQLDRGYLSELRAGPRENSNLPHRRDRQLIRLGQAGKDIS